MSPENYRNPRATWPQRLLLCATLCGLFVLTVGSKDEKPLTKDCCSTEDKVLLADVFLKRDRIIVQPSSGVLGPGETQTYSVTTLSQRTGNFEARQSDNCFPATSQLRGGPQTTESLSVQMGTAQQWNANSKNRFVFELASLLLAGKDWKAAGNDKLLASGKAAKPHLSCNSVSFEIESDDLQPIPIVAGFADPDDAVLNISIPIEKLAASVGLPLADSDLSALSSQNQKR